jgi:uncharacterized protein
LEDVLRHPAVIAAASGKAGLSAACRACPIVAACGGGLYPHRYRASNGFENPCVHRRDLALLITRVHERIQRDLPSYGPMPPGSGAIRVPERSDSGVPG